MRGKQDARLRIICDKTQEGGDKIYKNGNRKEKKTQRPKKDENNEKEER